LVLAKNRLNLEFSKYQRLNARTAFRYLPNDAGGSPDPKTLGLLSILGSAATAGHPHQR
jgi:hypothetical protein